MAGNILYSGSKFKIVFAVRSNNSLPAKEYFESLTNSEKAKFHVLFERIANFGKITNKEQFKKIEGTKLFEFKRSQLRFPCFFTENKEVVLTHGFQKKQQRIPKKEIEKAFKVKEEHLARRIK